MANPIEVQNIHSTLTSLSAVQITIIASSVGAIIAAFVAAIFSLLTTWLVKRAENERALRELIIKSAIEIHNQDFELAKAVPGRYSIMPLDGYVVHMTALLSVLMKNKITSDNVRTLLDQTYAITKESNLHLGETRFKGDADVL
jgi:hypothetical protein